MKTMIGMLTALLMGVAFASANPVQDVTATVVQIGDYCTGTVIQSEEKEKKIETLVLTAKHCTRTHLEEVTVNKRSSDGTKVEQWRGVVINRSFASDLALIKLDNTTDKLPVAEVAPRKSIRTFGDRMIVPSHPLGIETPILTDGTYSGPVKVDAFSDVSQSKTFDTFSLSVAPGSSGSAAFVWDVDHYVITNILTGHMPRAPWISFWTPTSELHDYLDLMKVEYAND